MRSYSHALGSPRGRPPGPQHPGDRSRHLAGGECPARLRGAAFLHPRLAWPGAPDRHHRPARCRQVHPDRAAGPGLSGAAGSPSRSSRSTRPARSPAARCSGDRIRMESVALDPGVFIRSMATRGSLGGLATTTREVCDVLDAGGLRPDPDRDRRRRAVGARCGADRRLDRAGAGPGIGRRDPDAQVRHHGDRRHLRGQQGRPPRGRPAAAGDRDHAGHPAGQRLPACAGAPRAPSHGAGAASGRAASRRRGSTRCSRPSPRRARESRSWSPRSTGTTSQLTGTGELRERRRRRLYQRTREVVERAHAAVDLAGDRGGAGDPGPAGRRRGGAD